MARGPARAVAAPALAVVGVLAIATILLAAARAVEILPPAAWLAALLAPAEADPRQLLFHYSFLPRIVLSLIGGAALSLAGAVFQQVLRNPLAEPATLGVSAGAQLALAIAMLWAPGLLGLAPEGIALAGSGAAMALVLALGIGARMSAVSLVLAGLMVSLLCGAIGAMLIVLNHDYLASLFIWQSGSLAQNGWAPAHHLLVEALALAAMCALFVRPLELIGLEDGGARSLGVPVGLMRGAMLALAVALSAVVTAAVGVIGFVGLAAPALARLLGARTLRQRLLWAPALGACLLALTDQVVQALTFLPRELPAGAATGLLGAPLLLWLLPRLRMHAPPAGLPAPPRRLSPPATTALLGCGLVLLVLMTVLSLSFGRAPQGWYLAGAAELEMLWPWRAPRVAAALACGAMLAAAGALMQRLTGNPMASPEVMGISAGASVGVILLMLLVPGFDPAWIMAAAGLGALATLAPLLAVSGRAGFSPDRLLLAGIALATFMSAAASVMLGIGDPRTASLIAWMSGSTYAVTEEQAQAACAVAVLLLAAAPLATRWLDILPFGPSTASALGVHVGAARLALLLLIAALTATATLIVGPLSFVGLLAPHMMRMAGVGRPLPHLFAAALAGALIMVLADWLGRNILFPWQVPAGLIAALIGAPYVLCLMRRQTA